MGFLKHFNNNIPMKIAGILWIIISIYLGEARGFYDDLSEGMRIFSHVFNIGVGSALIFVVPIMSYIKERKK